MSMFAAKARKWAREEKEEKDAGVTHNDSTFLILNAKPDDLVISFPCPKCQGQNWRIGVNCPDHWKLEARCQICGSNYLLRIKTHV